MISKTVRITAEVIGKMTDHAIQELPNECCGILSGKGGLIDGVHLCTNERASPSEFSIPFQELFDCFRFLREQDRVFMGIYHSHPKGPGVPSDRDEHEFYYRTASYWIVSLNNGPASVRCFEWGRNGFVELPFTVGQANSSGLSDLPD